jgi:carboxymethylenebutenolidase
MSTEPDLGALLDEHVAREFVVEDVEATMQTMVAEPYVWHVPSMAGGAGHEDVREFYATQFIGRMPGDIGIHPVSRTIASGRVIESKCPGSSPGSPRPGARSASPSSS